MAKKVIFDFSSGRVYRDLAEAAEGLGLGLSTVSRMVREQPERVRYVDRVYAIRVKESGSWRIGTLDSRNSAYCLMGQQPSKVRRSDVSESRELTEIWYRV